MNATIETFRSIVEDPQLSDQEIGKYLSWGKGNLQQALNYYYRKKDKENKEKEQPVSKRSESNVFEKMKNASIREKKTEEFIKNVKE